MYKTFKELCDSYGSAIAKGIRENKKASEKNRQPGEEAFWLKRPEIPDNEDSRSINE